MQGDYVSKETGTWLILVLTGPEENLTSASLHVINDENMDKVVEVLEIFFKTAFPAQAESEQALDWFLNNSGIRIGWPDGSTVIGNAKVEWAMLPNVKYFVSVSPKTP